MESVLGRYRNLIVLVGVLFAQVLGLAVQVNVKRTTDTEPTRLIRVWAVGAVSPLEKLLVWVQSSSGNLWHNYFYLRGVRAENRNLKAEIEQMRIAQVRMSQDADQARRLQALLGFKEQFISQTMAAQVIGGSGSELSRSVFIDKGHNDGVKPDMAVITADGIVGKVLHVYRSTSEVLRIDDQSSGVGAILDKTRLQGILNGTPAGELVLGRVMSDENVPVGELVLTSGGDSIFPKGLPIGRVTRVAQGSDLFLNIHVRPAADLSKLEEVLVVTKIDERQTQPDQKGAARAVDILAERLPSVPPPPNNAVKGAVPGPATPGTTRTTTTTTTKTTKTVVPGTVQPKIVGSTTSGSTNVPPPTAASNGRPKPSSQEPAASNGAPAARKTTTTATPSGTPSATKPTAASTETGKPSPKSVKPATESEPQPQPQSAAQNRPH
jgi:rod shape-determining protein MreC